MDYSELTNLVVNSWGTNSDALWKYKTPLKGQLLSEITKGASTPGLISIPTPRIEPSNSSTLKLSPFSAYVADASKARSSAVLDPETGTYGSCNRLPMVLVETAGEVSINLDTALTADTEFYVVLVYKYTQSQSQMGNTPLATSSFTLISVSEYESLPSINSIQRRVDDTVYLEDLCIVAKVVHTTSPDKWTAESIPWRTTSLDAVTLYHNQIIYGRKSFEVSPLNNDPNIANPITGEGGAASSSEFATVKQLHDILIGEAALPVGWKYEGSITVNNGGFIGGVFVE